jgi:hypothetical protein
MTSRQHKKEMLDYLVEKLKGSGEKIVPRHIEFFKGMTTNYIRVGDNGIVLLLDQAYPGERSEQAYSGLGKFSRRAVVILKDGKTFFRNAAEDNTFKQKYELSLKNYSTEEMHRMIQFRPEEIYLVSEVGKSRLQYFQPTSAMLSPMNVSYSFEPVEFDYSHIDSSCQFKPEDRESTRLFIWSDKREYAGTVLLGKSNLMADKPENRAKLAELISAEKPSLPQ